MPAYRDMDPYDLPEEFAHLQAQDMGKLGFMQDLIRGIKKILRKGEPKPQTVVQQPVSTPANNVAPLLKRAFMFLEDGDFARADDFCEQVLNLDPENGRAYLGKLMAQLKVRREADLKDQPQPFDSNNHYQKIMRFGNEALKKQIKGDIDFINARNEHDRQKGIYDRAVAMLANAQTVQQCRDAKRMLDTIPRFEGVERQIEACDEKIECINLSHYNEATRLQRDGSWQDAIREYESLGDYRDSRTKIAECEESIREHAYHKAQELLFDGKWDEAARAFEKLGSYRDSIKQIQQCNEAKAAERLALEQRRQQGRLEAERKAKAEAAKKRRITMLVVCLIALAIAAVVMFVKCFIKPNNIYNSAVRAMEAGRYDEATEIFEGLGEYSDAATQVLESQYQKGCAMLEQGRSLEALSLLRKVGSDYRDTAELLKTLESMIIEISAGYQHTVGLRADGTVVTVGSNGVGRCDTGNWTDIVAVAAGSSHTMGLRADGTVTAVGSNIHGQCDTGDWKLW